MCIRDRWYITGALSLLLCWSLVKILTLRVLWVALGAVATALSALLANLFIGNAKLVPLVPMIVAITALSVILLFDKRDEENREWADVYKRQLWKCHNWGELTLYYFPVKFLESLNPTLRRISITFIHNLMRANGISTILEEDDTDYVLMWLQEDDPQEEEEDTKKRMKLVQSYGRCV